MAIDKRAREQMRAHCREIHADDGVDPNEFFKSHRRRGKADHRVAQLCRQVAEALDLVLSGEMRDELLQSLRVASVTPAPDSSRLMVTLYSGLTAEEFERSEIEARLARQSGRLRCAVAAAITRRKTPNLTYVIMAAAPTGGDPR